jgi:formylglycine-generating enzyme
MVRILPALLALVFCGCWHVGPLNEVMDTAGDASGDSDSDSDADADADGDTDGDTDSDSGSDSDTDSDADTDADSDADTDGDTDSGAGSDSEMDTSVDGVTTPGKAGTTWVRILGGEFKMGSPLSPDEEPVHRVTVPTFEMLKTEVTVTQYATCVDASACTVPDESAYFCPEDQNWGVSGQEGHPMNCVSWQQAVEFCTWMGGRLPTEAEWEYAARSGGQISPYPWGDEVATCAYAVMFEGGYGCNVGYTAVVCSKTAGNTDQGLCDMAGNVREWVQDAFHYSYDGAPTDGSAWEGPDDSDRVTRGGSGFCDWNGVRVASRWGDSPSGIYDVGLRCAR